MHRRTLYHDFDSLWYSETMYISRVRLLILLLLVLVLLAGGVLLRGKFLSVPQGAEILSFKDCAEAGYPVMPARREGGESYPRQCRTPDGILFIEEIGEENFDTNGDTPEEKNGDEEEKIQKQNNCRVTGCSGQICGDADIITTCEYQPEYACYQNAVCDLQADGQCGWTLTAGLGRCLMETGDSKVDQISVHVTGTVSLGPTCPVVQNPPADECAGKPYETTIEIFSINNTTFPLQTIETNASGRFSADIPYGSYVFRPKGGNPFPICKDQDVHVEANKISEIVLSCDMGIR